MAVITTAVAAGVGAATSVAGSVMGAKKAKKGQKAQAEYARQQRNLEIANSPSVLSEIGGVVDTGMVLPEGDVAKAETFKLEDSLLGGLISEEYDRFV